MTGTLLFYKDHLLDC